jgi:hypothetical protein
MGVGITKIVIILQTQWLVLLIVTSWEVEIRRIMV